MTKVLVTGGLGYLGSNLVKGLVEQNHDVRILGHTRKPEGLVPREVTDIVYGDIRDAPFVRNAVDGVEIVMHTVSNFRKGGSDKGEAYSTNVEGTRNVLHACVKQGVRQLIHCSTIGVHGSVLEVPATETTPFNPGDLYQETKVTSENEVVAYSREKGLNTTVIRPISLIGPGDMRMVKLFRMIKKGRFFIVGKGEVLFQPAYIDDVVKGFLLCMDNEKAIGETFILGSEEYLTLNDLVGKIASLLQVKPPGIHLPMLPLLILASLCEWICVPLGLEPPLHRRRMSFFQNNRAFSIEKAKDVLGYRPGVSLSDALARTADWYQQEGLL